MSASTPSTTGAIASMLPRSEIRDVMDAGWRADGTIHLEVGEPAFATPPHIVEAAVRAARDGKTRYLPNAGLPALREALVEKLRERNGYDVGAEQIVITNGAVQGLYATLAAVCDPGDEVLLPDPAWPNFRMQAHLLGLRAVGYPLHPETGFLPCVDDLERLAGPRTRAVLINSPSNPLGAVIPADRSRELVVWAERRGVWVISDEAYDELDFDGTFASTAAAAPSPNIVSIYSFSKVHAMTGWRVGYVVAQPDLAATITRLQEPLVSCINAPAQHGALAAVTGPHDAVTRMREEYAQRRDVALEELDRCGIVAHRPAGAFYVWVDVSTAGRGDRAFAIGFLAARGVAVAPGTAFGPGGSGAVRLSIAACSADIVTGIRCLGEHLEGLRG